MKRNVLNTGNIEILEPQYFYKVFEFVTSFEKDKGKTKPFSHSENFKGRNIKQCRELATKYYFERLNGLNNGKFFLPFETPKKFVLGKNSVFSIILFLVEYYNEDNYLEHPILGEDEETTLEGKEIENTLFNSKN
jgi:hypothetical protein